MLAPKVSSQIIQPTPHETPSRVSELDGLRGLAILLVIAFHTFKRADVFTESAFLHQISAFTRIGWAGVDIFFVLSGFLISGILLKTGENPHYFKNFYVRRILRIFPLYYLVVIVLLIFLPQIDNISGKTTQSFWPVFLLYQQNWLYLLETEPSLLIGFTWSLAIEEQFYFLWPALVYVLNKRALAWTSLIIIVGSIALRLILMLPVFNIAGIKDFFYYGTITRFEGLALGGLIALVFHTGGIWQERLTRWARPTLGGSLGLMTILAISGAPSPTANNTLLTIFGYTLLALIAGSLIVLFSTRPPTAFIRRIFRNRTLLFFGKYSYAMYMLHPAIVIILLEVLWKTHRQNGWMWLLYIFLSFGLTILLSLLSWHLLEKHALKLKKYFE